MNYVELIEKAEAFVSKYMRKHDNPKLLYHNLAHTQNIVSVTSQIAKQYSLDETEFFIVTAASWFLFIGYYKDLLHPNDASTKLAEEFFKDSGVPEETIESIKECILAPANTSAPTNLLASIICDADSFYLGTENFSDFNKLKRKEYRLLNNVSVDKNEWKRRTIQMLETHQYYSDYGKALDSCKQEHLEKLKKKDPLLSITPHSIATAIAEKDVTISAKDKSRENKASSADRTIETMFRTTAANSQRLSSQADSKAHIMISVNTIIISVILGLVARQIDEFTTLDLIPIVVILLVNIITVIFSILATRPNVANRNFSESDFDQNKVNLLFFGNFFNMSFDDYCNFMMRIMGDKQSLYIVMLRNLYEQGMVLTKKYRMLKISYNVFMYGLILSIITFLIAAKFNNASNSAFKGF